MQKIQLRLGEQNAILLSHHNSFVMVVNTALGGESEQGPKAPGKAGYKNLAEGHSDVESAMAAINRAMMI